MEQTLSELKGFLVAQIDTLDGGYKYDGSTNLERVLNNAEYELFIENETIFAKYESEEKYELGATVEDCLKSLNDWGNVCFYDEDECWEIDFTYFLKVKDVRDCLYHIIDNYNHVEILHHKKIGIVEVNEWSYMDDGGELTPHELQTSEEFEIDIKAVEDIAQDLGLIYPDMREV